ncbi:MAG: DUF2306 domain-containing protein [Myxococcota bacterium]
MEQYHPSPRTDGQGALRASVAAWYTVTAIGQWLFVAFIVGYYFVRTFSGDFAAWNEKPLIDGYKEGQWLAHLGFAVHSTLAAVMTATGTLQLNPWLRRRAPRVHRMSGRVFLVSACVLAASGLALTWIRGTYLSTVSAVAVSVDAVLIFITAALALRSARLRDFERHRRWALRLFMVANGVWMLRVGMMFWAVTTGGWGMSRAMDGPFDSFWAFGCYLLPLAMLELYFGVEARGRPARVTYSVALGVSTLAMAVGIFGTVALLWLPYL